MIVGPEPSRCILSDLIYRSEQVLIEPIVSDRSVLALDISVLLRLSGLDMLDSDLVPFGPSSQGLADVLRTVVPAEWLA